MDSMHFEWKFIFYFYQIVVTLFLCDHWMIFLYIYKQCMNSTGMETFIENHTVLYPYQNYSFGIIIYCDYFLFVFFFYLILRILPFWGWFILKAIRSNLWHRFWIWVQDYIFLVFFWWFTCTIGPLNITCEGKYGLLHKMTFHPQNFEENKHN